MTAAHPPPLSVVLVEPEIPPNTGNIARLCVASGARLHLIGPLGFSMDEKHLRRAGMDYWERCDWTYWESLDALRDAAGAAARFFYLTTRATRPYWDARFAPGDYLVFGRETRGLPASLLAANPASCLTIPMVPDTRSINLATAAGIVLFEAVRQLAASGS